MELLTQYPALDGLHFDYIRYPDVLPFSPGLRFGVGISLGHGARAARALRRGDRPRRTVGDSLGNGSHFDDWRREKLTELVAHVAHRARVARPDLEISAAVISYADRAYLSLFQDWRGWLEEGLIDVAVPMLYSKDPRLVKLPRAEHFAGLPYADRIWVGLGSWLFADEPQRAVAQLDEVESRPPLGVALFSWDSIRQSDRSGTHSPAARRRQKQRRQRRCRRHRRRRPPSCRRRRPLPTRPVLPRPGARCRRPRRAVPGARCRRPRRAAPAPAADAPVVRPRRPLPTPPSCRTPAPAPTPPHPRRDARPRCGRSTSNSRRSGLHRRPCRAARRRAPPRAGARERRGPPRPRARASGVARAAATCWCATRPACSPRGCAAARRAAAPPRRCSSAPPTAARRRVRCCAPAGGFASA